MTESETESDKPDTVGWFGWAWVAGVSAFAIARALIAWPTLGRYGVNPWVFLALDVGTAPPYAYGQVKLVKSILKRAHAQTQFWTVVVLVSFLAPYIYVFVAGSGELPAIGYAIVAVLAGVFGAASIARFRRTLRSEQAAA